MKKKDSQPADKMATTVAPASRRHADDYFFLAMFLLVLATVFIGFARTYFLAGIFHARLPSPLVHLHGAIFSCWILLLFAQTSLVSIGHVRWHMRLGFFGAVLAGLMVIVGFATLVGALRRHAHFGMTTESLFAVDVLQLSLFAVLVSWALLVRGHPSPQAPHASGHRFDLGAGIKPLATRICVFELLCLLRYP